MKAALFQLTPSGEIGRRYDVRDGSRVEFGRTDWADCCIRDDPAMAEVHFAVECRHDACLLTSLVHDRDTLVNDEKVDEAAPLRTGDRVTAGKTTFVVSLDGAPLPTEVLGAAAAASADRPPATDFVELCKYLALDDALPLAAADPGLSRDAFLQRLVDAGRHAAAARLYAHWLPKRAAVWWGCLCVREACGPQLPTPQEAAWNAAKAWVEKPAEETRRRAEAALEAADDAGPGGMLAAAAFTAGDNIAPADSPTPVAPDPRLSGHSVKTALVYAAVAGDPRRAVERWRWFLILAQDITAGKITLPGDP